jgi:hypothetical protein
MLHDFDLELDRVLRFLTQMRNIPGTFDALMSGPYKQTSSYTAQCSRMNCLRRTEAQR